MNAPFKIPVCPISPTWIKELRTRLRLTQDGLAQLIGVTFSTVNRWERGHVFPSRLARRQLVALADETADADSRS